MSFVRRQLPAILFGAAILGMSGPWASATHTGSWTEPFLARLGLPAGLVWAVHQALRKFGHFVAYGLFAVLALRALAGDRPPTRRLAFRALLLALLLSSVDETLQGFALDRGGSPFDVLLDGAGAATALLLLLRRPASERRSPVVEAVTAPAGDGSAR